MCVVLIRLYGPRNQCVESITGGCEISMLWSSVVLPLELTVPYKPGMVRIITRTNSNIFHSGFHSHCCGHLAAGHANVTALPTYIRASTVNLVNLSEQTSDLNINHCKYSPFSLNAHKHKSRPLDRVQTSFLNLSHKFGLGLWFKQTEGFHSAEQCLGLLWNKKSMLTYFNPNNAVFPTLN